MELPLIKKTKAQSGNQSAILVIIITVLLILFILSISPEERDKLLNDNTTNSGTDTAFPNSITLIRANPGQIPFSENNEIIHDFAPFSLDAKVKAELIHTKNSLYLKNSAFEKVTDTLVFKATPEITSNVLLNFNVEQASGSLIIKLNGETIFNSPVSAGNSPAITISASSLKTENTMEFYVSGPGAAFWKYNSYSLKNINIYADILDLTKSKTSQVFNIEKKEIEDLKISTLRYLPACNPTQVKNMTIKINNFEIFSGIPDCVVFNDMPIPTQYLHEGVNEVTFQIQQGTVLIDRARILNELKQPYMTTYYFQVQDKYFNFVKDEYVLKSNYESMLDLTFPNNDQRRLEIIFNGKPISFNTARLRETRNANLFLQPGTNSIQIKPLTEVTMTELRIRIREK